MPLRRPGSKLTVCTTRWRKCGPSVGRLVAGLWV
jgi:hypothetical protein